MGFRWTIQSFWVKSHSTTLWPFHWPGPSQIKGEHRGRSVIKSGTLIVNFPLCHYCTGARTHTRLTLILPAMEVVTPCTRTEKGMRVRMHDHEKPWQTIFFNSVCKISYWWEMIYLKFRCMDGRFIKRPLLIDISKIKLEKRKMAICGSPLGCSYTHGYVSFYKYANWKFINYIWLV